MWYDFGARREDLRDRQKILNVEGTVFHIDKNSHLNSWPCWTKRTVLLYTQSITPVKCRIVNMAYLNFNSKLELERQKIRSRKTDIFTEIMISPWN